MALHTRRCVRPHGRRGLLFLYREEYLNSVVVLVTLLYSGLVLRTLGDSSQDVRVCRYNTSTPVEGVHCKALDSNISSCNISRLIDYHCYLNQNYDKCKKYGVEYNITSSGRELTLSKLNETTLPIVVTTNEDDNDTSWLLETQNASMVIVTGLPENFTVKNCYTFNNQNCPGCPMPTINWYPFPSKHKIVFEVLLDDKNIQVLGNKVLVRMYSSNDSSLSDDINCLMGLKPDPRIISGLVNTRLTIRDIYNTQFCVNFELTDPVDKNGSHYYYACGRHLDMKEPPKIPIPGEIGTPVWLTVTLALISAIFLMVILALFAAKKGWLRAPFSSLLEPRRVIQTNNDPSTNAPNVVTADITTDTTTVTMKPTNTTVTKTPITKSFRAISASEEKRLSATSLEQSVPFLNGVGPKANDAFSGTITKPRR